MVLCVVSSRKKNWRYVNLIHLCFVRISNVYVFSFSFYDNPKLAEDMIQTHTVLAHTLISVSVGKLPKFASLVDLH
jgi:hypothetical protein